jgi:hypothetical protein
MRPRLQSSFNERSAKEARSSPQEGDKACPWQEAHIRKDMMMNGIRGLLDREEGHVYGTLLPIVRTPEGNREFAVPGLLRDAYTAAIDAITLPGDVYAGRRDPTVENAINFALTFMGAGQAIPAPKGSLRMFAGRNAKTADLDALKKAQKMADKDTSAADILSETGWFKGADGKWRFEIDDSAARVRGVSEPKLSRGGMYTSEDVLEHPALYEAYPELARIQTGPTVPQNAVGVFDKSENYIGNRRNRVTDPDAFGSTQLHELQHAIQAKEGFAPGAMPEMFKSPQTNPLKSDAMFEKARLKKAVEFYKEEIEAAEAANAGADILRELDTKLMVAKEDLKIAEKYMDEFEYYLREAGEVEARNVQNRRKLTAQERRKYSPFVTQDFDYGEQLLVGPTGRITYGENFVKGLLF